jgi:hypothetical protein
MLELVLGRINVILATFSILCDTFCIGDYTFGMDILLGTCPYLFTFAHLNTNVSYASLVGFSVLLWALASFYFMDP